MSALRDSGHGQQGSGVSGLQCKVMRKEDSDSESEVREHFHKACPRSRRGLASGVIGFRAGVSLRCACSSAGWLDRSLKPTVIKNNARCEGL